MMENKGRSEDRTAMTRKKSIGSIQWLFQAFSGAFIIVFLGVHLYVAHINGGSPIELFSAVVTNLRNPWWMAFFLVFLWIVTYHGLNGVKGIIYETGISVKTRRLVSYVLTAVFIASVIYGTALSFIVAAMAIP